MTMALPLSDLSRNQVLLKVSLPDGAVVFDMKPFESELGTPLPPTDLELHFATTKGDNGLELTMWASSRASTATTSQNLGSTWDWQEDFKEESLMEHPPPSATVSPLETSFGACTDSLLDPSSSFLDPIQLPTPPGETSCIPMNQQECQMPDAFSSMDIFSLNGMIWSDFSPVFPDTSEPLPEFPLPASSSYLPPSPGSDVTSSSTHSSYLPLASPAVSSTPSTFPSPKEETQRVPQLGSPPVPATAPAPTEGNALRPHPCLFPECGRWFTRSYTRNVHMLTHRRSNDPKPFVCTIPGCSEGFSRKHDRLRHEVRQHGRGSNWRCPLCPLSKFYSSQSTLERHISEKHSEGG
ncbi:hypothetical protein EDD18DRAFT_1207795 [Armillaria luteobubalina]|uniref:C2H2-type domain-containing protein n=1 Tax=Armillaria luteobubalina TaxID=153913 RepID=A0AA39P7W2_9AGAR|nr:hypothetical protein EDD18DRAFT_1207795 [Armillaria luteobubalina]